MPNPNRGACGFQSSEFEQEYERPSKSEAKRQSLEVQKLGEELVNAPRDRVKRVPMPEDVLDAILMCQTITNHEGRRRQMQFVGKLMRLLDPETLQAARDALEEQNKGSARETEALHLAEKWREDLVREEDALAKWLTQFPDTDTQQVRALIRQARKDNPHDKAAQSEGKAPRHSRAWRDLFQLVREQLANASEA